MNASDIEQYEYQLSQIKLALAKDPHNAEYLNLKDELQSLIDLTKEYLASQPSTAAPAAGPSASTSSNSTPTPRPSAPAAAARSTTSASASPRPAAPSAPPATAHKFKTGDECQARYSGDSKFYPARITSIGGSEPNFVYSVIFRGYESTELVGSGDVKPLTEHKKRELELTEEDKEKERKRKKNEKREVTKKEKQAEQEQRQKGWQSFAKKSTKKGVKIPGVSGASLFRSPEDLNPNAKVGVVGSGRGMTKATERKRQTFLGGADE
ncbi:hypothetical protein BCR35DRAFT_305233 [Leucosporidium creatinivorum]|uniref:Tudor domain-containing protein n=1 Tax=Leucosporidium creatinivorum TaxID=106004 RepID=A0A1Y2F3K0_9BASI|nr:hypothetical protein BCR35DRAFT_305233 [Leucosporidium creatinivorum]